MKKESKLNLNAGDYAISHCDSDKTYNGLEVHKMLCDAYIAGNNDTLDDEAYRKAYYDGYNKCNRDWIYSQEAEQEKYDFVSGRFIECRKSFNEFKEDNSYWLEYIGDDNYIGRSDNILNQKFHITPRQLFTLFTWQHSPKEDSNVNDETNAPTEYGKYVDECLNEASKHFFSNGEDAYSVADFKGFIRNNTSTLESHFNECIDWLKSIKNRVQPEQEWSEEDEQHVNSLLKRLEGMCKKGATYTATRFAVSQDIEWLKSLKERKGGKI